MRLIFVWLLPSQICPFLLPLPYLCTASGLNKLDMLSSMRVRDRIFQPLSIDNYKNTWSNYERIYEMVDLRTADWIAYA